MQPLLCRPISPRRRAYDDYRITAVLSARPQPQPSCAALCFGAIRGANSSNGPALRAMFCAVGGWKGAHSCQTQRRRQDHRPLRHFQTRSVGRLHLIVTVKVNYIDPQAWMADVLARLPNITASRVHELLPWHWKVHVKTVNAAPAGCEPPTLNPVHIALILSRKWLDLAFSAPHHRLSCRSGGTLKGSHCDCGKNLCLCHVEIMTSVAAPHSTMLWRGFEFSFR